MLFCNTLTIFFWKLTLYILRDLLAPTNCLSFVVRRSKNRAKQRGNLMYSADTSGFLGAISLSEFWKDESHIIAKTIINKKTPSDTGVLYGTDFHFIARSTEQRDGKFTRLMVNFRKMVDH